MLCLSRKVEEKILLFVPGREPIAVQVIDIKGDRVRLAFEADRDVVIHREEVAAAIAREAEEQ